MGMLPPAIFKCGPGNVCVLTKGEEAFTPGIKFSKPEEFCFHAPHANVGGAFR